MSANLYNQNGLNLIILDRDINLVKMKNLINGLFNKIKNQIKN